MTFEDTCVMSKADTLSVSSYRSAERSSGQLPEASVAAGELAAWSIKYLVCESTVVNCTSLDRTRQRQESSTSSLAMLTISATSAAYVDDKSETVATRRLTRTLLTS